MHRRSAIMVPWLVRACEKVRTLSAHVEQADHSLADALGAAQDIAARSTRLQQATAALARAQTEDDVADALLRYGVPAVNARRGFLARMENDGVAIVRAWGYTPEVEARLLGARKDLTVVLRALDNRQPMWVRSPEEHAALYRLYPSLEVLPVPHASASIPLVHDDSVFGVLALIFVEPSTIGPTTESFSLLLAQAASDAMFRARSYDAERAARQHAELLAQARADVLSVVAHDLRNPLHLVMSSASLLMERGDLPPTQQKMLAISQRASQQMNRLINDLLDATRLEAGRLTLALGEVDAAALVRDTEETMQPTARERGVDLLVEAPDVPAPLVADEGRLLQALGNLVGNAIKFTGAGGRVALSATHDEGAMRFSVADSGPGIEARHLEHLFDSFWQARDGDRRGVGLGLTITKRIVEAHAGRIWVKSTVGVGSTFSFAIPVSAPSRAMGRMGSPAGNAAMSRS